MQSMIAALSQIQCQRSRGSTSNWLWSGPFRELSVQSKCSSVSVVTSPAALRTLGPTGTVGLPVASLPSVQNMA